MTSGERNGTGLDVAVARGRSMQAYIAKRFLLFIPTLLMATLVAFLAAARHPGRSGGGEAGRGDRRFQLHASRAARSAVKLGTDQPLYVQYGKWLWDMVHLDFGQSMFFEEPVANDLAEKFPITLELTVLAMLIATVIAVPLGLISAIKQDTAADYVARVISIAGVALPNFWVGILIVYFLVLLFSWMPPLGYASLWDDPLTNLQQFFFPALALGIYQMAFMARVTRSSMLEVYREDYTRTARGKGLAERVVILRHALKNALLPVVTISGYEFGRLLAGTVVIENIFMIPGMGRLLVDSVFHRDYTDGPGHRHGDHGHGADPESGSGCRLRLAEPADPLSVVGQSQKGQEMPQDSTSIAAPPQLLPVRGVLPIGAIWQHIIWFARKKPLGAFGAVVALLLIIVAIFAPLIATHDPNATELRPGLCAARIGVTGWAAIR